MTETMKLVEENVSVLDTVEINAEGRTDYSDGTLMAVFPADSDTTEYVVSEYKSNAENTVELPSKSVVLSAENGQVTALTPVSAFGNGGEK